MSYALAGLVHLWGGKGKGRGCRGVGVGGRG